MSKIYNQFSNILLICFCSFSLWAQPPDQSDIYTVIYLDSLTVTAKRQGFDVEDFIDLVLNDRSFYSAFKNLRSSSYHFDTNMSLSDKKGKEIAAYRSSMIQHFDGKCRTMEIVEESAEGNFYKRKNKYRYYTARMLDRLFFTHGRYCNSTDPDAPPSSKMEEYVAELKQLIFEPGAQIDVPFIGKKTEIFEPKMMSFYDYSLTSQAYKDGRDCYVFTVSIKPEYESKKEGKTIIKFLETYFDKTTFQVVARNYRLQYQHLAFDFDVEMDISLTKIGSEYFPTLVRYQGQWDIPAKKPEIAQFTIQLYDFNGH